MDKTYVLSKMVPLTGVEPALNGLASYIHFHESSFNVVVWTISSPSQVFRV